MPTLDWLDRERAMRVLDAVPYSMLEPLAVDPVGNTFKEFAHSIAANITKWTGVAKAANIKAD